MFSAARDSPGVGLGALVAFCTRCGAVALMVIRVVPLALLRELGIPIRVVPLALALAPTRQHQHQQAGVHRLLVLMLTRRSAPHRHRRHCTTRPPPRACVRRYLKCW